MPIQWKPTVDMYSNIKKSYKITGDTISPYRTCGVTEVEEVCRADLAVNLTQNADVNKVFAFSQTQLGYKTNSDIVKVSLFSPPNDYITGFP